MRTTDDFGKGKTRIEDNSGAGAGGLCGAPTSDPAAAPVMIFLKPRRREAQADARALRKLIRAAASACGYRAKISPGLPRRRRRRGAAGPVNEPAGN